MDSSLDEFAFRLFRQFAQYEYALKVLGYAHAGNNNRVELEWDRFANDIGTVLLQETTTPEVTAARPYLFEHPPKRQVWVQGVVEWEQVPNSERSAQILFSHIRRVRNNLYHGGKFNGRWIDPDRSQELISKSLLLLEALASSNPTLSEAILGNAV
jgi:hypothetical protein